MSDHNDTLREILSLSTAIELLDSLRRLHNKYAGSISRESSHDILILIYAVENFILAEVIRLQSGLEYHADCIARSRNFNRLISTFENFVITNTRYSHDKRIDHVGQVGADQIKEAMINRILNEVQRPRP